MKKILLGTTALIGASLLASVAAAEAPKVTVGGNSTFEAGWVSEDQDAGLRSYGLRNDNEINVNVDGKSDAGLEYGAELILEADVTDDADSEGTNAARTNLYLQGGFGRVEMGSAPGVATTMKVDASNIAAATGGIDGDWTYFASSSTGFIATPDLPLAYGAGNLGDESTENNTKITYYSPNFNGFQAGLSYSVDTSDRGQDVSRVDTTAGEAQDIFDIALKYAGEFSGFRVAAAGTYEHGDSEGAALEDLNAWNLGATIEASGISAALSYGDWDDSLRASGTDGDYWTAGLAYAGGNYNASITYINSELGDNEFDNISVGVDYAAAPGLTPFAEISFFDQEAPGAANDNDGTVGIVGVSLGF